MGDYDPQEWHEGDTFEAADATAMSQELDEQEQHDATQDNAIAGKVDKIVGPRVQEFVATTASGSLELRDQPVPSRAIGVRVTMIPAGSGGGSGRRGAPGTNRYGGGGGAPSPTFDSQFIPLQGNTLWGLCLSAPGVGGAAVTTDDTNGNDGTVPDPNGFRLGAGTGNPYLRMGGANWGNQEGNGGTATGGAGGAASSGTTCPSGGAGGNGNGGNGSPSWGFVASSAGGGGGINTANAPGNGGAGGGSYGFIPLAASDSAGGVVDGALPRSVGDTSFPVPGQGAGGGAASITQAAQAGADGIGYGAPGGGGGASTNGFPSGRGGNGGPGYCRLEWVYA